MQRIFRPSLKCKRRKVALRFPFGFGPACVVLAALAAESPQYREQPPAQSPERRQMPPAAQPQKGGLPLTESPENREIPPAPAIAPALSAAPTAPAPPPPPILLHAGEKVTLRVLQVIPADGLSPGERLLNSRHLIAPGDHFLAEVIEPRPKGPAMLGGVVTKVAHPGWFGRPGYVSLQLAQFVRTADGKAQEAPWQFDTQDQSKAARMRRALLTAVITGEWAIVGASAGAQDLILSNASWIGAAAGIGGLLGLGFASMRPGADGVLEPGDTFCIVVGTMKYQPVPRDWQTILYPAADPRKKKPRR